MTKHPGYPPNYHSVIECRVLGLCWWCFKRKAPRQFVNKPCCSVCRRKYEVKG